MTEKWTKIVARNCYPVHWSAQLHQKLEGVNLGKLHWGLTKDLLIKYETPLSHLFAYSGNALETNFLDYAKEINTDLEDALNQAISIIEEDLALEPGTNLNDVALFYQRFKLVMGIMVMGFWWNLLIEDVLKSHLGSESWEKQRDSIMHPYRKTLLTRENEAIINLQKRYSEGNLSDLEVETFANQLAEEYGFVHSEYKAKEWTIEDYVREIKRRPKEEQVDSTQATPSNSEYVDWLIKIAGRCAYIFDEGKSAVVRANWALRKTLIKLGHDETLVLNCTEEEFLNWTTTEELPLHTDLRERDKYYAILVWDGQIYEYTSKDSIQNLIQQEGITEFQQIKDEISQVKGQVAYRGVVRGKVKILFSQQDAAKLEEGEILVASMTTPELLSAMRKAGAFVTDEGGITCHAAIVAREFKTPCVIGTKIATKAFKDGDFVEVDANIGIITNISEL